MFGPGWRERGEEGSLRGIASREEWRRGRGPRMARLEMS